METLLVVLGMIAVLEGLHSLWRGRGYNRQFECPGCVSGDWRPPVTLILPCRGADPSLAASLKAFSEQSYPDYQLLLVVDSGDRRTHRLLARAADGVAGCVKVLTADPALTRGQKVHNLLYALEHVRASDHAVVFADSDIQPDRDWLSRLVRPLADSRVGISTGFRWYVPGSNRLASHLRSLWNAGGASLMSPGDSPFAWGGAMAIRRETIERCGLVERWQGVLSDDYTAAEAVRRCGLKIRFEPGSLSLSREECTLRELVAWTFRQLAITRVYSPRLWSAALAAHGLSSLLFWGAVALGVARAAGYPLPGGSEAFVALIASWYLLGALKSGLRLRAVGRVIPNPAGSVTGVVIHLFAGPLSSLISLVGLIRGGLSREIVWRGIRYRMVSNRKTEVLAVEDVPKGRKGHSVL